MACLFTLAALATYQTFGLAHQFEVLLVCDTMAEALMVEAALIYYIPNLRNIRNTPIA